ncbi:hypothetical protein DFR55_1352 [Herbinix hemicellulosilytica]|uniref:Sugar-phosphatase n=1 Tax=Herbinix hemicellulosilytica TaxID=1564487 RepID=A0A0H5STA2_HERHM|nr:sugar-phosphatase [Herbinix hemicellulosilytica]RBP56870.1 hypothetical protein DFR55_1352 [Herbinix hemicellulosilytica]CRZ33508.1 putative protein YxeH [Herbinix hemicellulosilytica]
MYKLIAVDLDGTLLNEDKKISERCREDVKKLKEMGKKIVIATGRPMKGILPFIETLDLFDENNYVVIYNGAMVQSTVGEKIIYDMPVSLESYKELYELSRKLDVNIHALTVNRVLTPKFNPYTEVESSINQIPVVEGPVDEIDASTKIVKVMFVDEPEKLDSVIVQLPDWVKQKYSVQRSAPIFLEFLNKKANKGIGVSIVAKELGIKPEEVICVGDAGNDIDMIKYAGLGVAMGNATDDVKAAADFITLTNEEDGVAQVIEKFML